VKKCNDDGLPIEKQCEVGSVVPTALPSKVWESAVRLFRISCKIRVWGRTRFI
jgi:hypothetical protein